jgi:nitrate reductase gamma subunit
MSAADEIARSLISAWKRGSFLPRFVIIVAGVLALSAFVVSNFAPYISLGGTFAYRLTLTLGVGAAFLVVGVTTYERAVDQRQIRRKIEVVEQKVRENPRETQLAWELAQTKLESYLNRNLGQVRSIFWLTALVMLVGFGFVLFGILKAIDAPDKLPIAVVSAASGVLISFIGGSFLLIYRSTMTQSKDYVAVLERINAVGMAVQIVEGIPDTSAELKHQTTAQIARQLIGMYASDQAGGSNERESRTRSRATKTKGADGDAGR